MEYFRSLGTSLLQQSGVVLPFALGDKVQAYENEGTIWSLYDGVKRVSPRPGGSLEERMTYLSVEARDRSPRSVAAPSFSFGDGRQRWSTACLVRAA